MLTRIASVCLAVTAVLWHGPTAAQAFVPDERDHIVVVGSTLIEPFTRAATERIQAQSGLNPTVIRPTGTGRGLSAFCAGVGTDTPDIVAMSRRMRHWEFESCQTNGVSEIIEIQIGFEAIVVISRLDAPIALTLDDLYRGLAAELPSGIEFLRNRHENWNDVRSGLPPTPINAVLPSRELGAFGFFSDRMLQAACRSIPEIKAIFDASERVEQCVGLRRDGRVHEVGLPLVETMRAAFQEARPGTIGIVSLRHAHELADVAQIITFDGQVATHQSIADLEYPYIRALYFYVKRAHVKNWQGGGPVAGLREFITEITREETIGPEGYLVRIGLVPMSEPLRETVRRNALSLRPFTR